MALSEHEKQLLAEMERNFYASEADVVETAAPKRQLNQRSVVLGVVLFLGGIGLLLAGVMLQQVLIGVAGFGVMICAIVLATTPAKSVPAATAAGDSAQGPGAAGIGGAAARPKKPSGTGRNPLIEWAERRWEQREDGDR